MNETEREPAESKGMTTWQKIRMVIAALLLLLLGIFLAMNFTSTPVWFFGLNFQLPLILLALICFAIGFMCGWVGNIWYKRRLLDE